MKRVGIIVSAATLLAYFINGFAANIQTSDNQCVQDATNLMMQDGFPAQYTGPMKIATQSPWPNAGFGYIQMSALMGYACSNTTGDCPYMSDISVTNCVETADDITVSMSGDVGIATIVIAKSTNTPPAKTIIVSMVASVSGVIPNRDSNEIFTLAQ